MNQGGGGYQPAPTTVVVVPTHRSRAPYYMRQSVRVGGLALGIPCVICMCLFGGMFILSGSVSVAMAQSTSDIWDRHWDSSHPGKVIGGILLTAGILLVVGGIALGVYAKEKFKNFDGTGMQNPGRVINPSPNMTPGQPGQLPPGQYAPGQLPPGQPSPYHQPYPQPGVMPGQPGAMTMTYQYTPPGQVVPPPVQPGAPSSVDPNAYPSAPAGYPTAPGGYPAPGGYQAPAGYPGGPAYGAPQPPATNYPTKGDNPPPYAP